MSIIYRCRLCLKSCRNKIDVFKDDFPKMIEILTGLKVDLYDNFPKTSCMDCAKNVKNALKTRKLIIQSHKRLLEEFLAKCRENHMLESEITESGGIETEKRVTETVDLSCKIEKAIETRKSSRFLKITKLDQTLSEADNTIPKVLSNLKEVEDPPLINASRIKDSESTEVKDADDSNSCDSSSPLSDPTVDVDWEPDKSKIKSSKCVEESNQPNKPPLKASDGVFFVKKRRTTAARMQKSPETVVRIKKKTKGRVPPSRVACDVCKREVQSYWLQKHMETHEYNPVTCEFCGLVSKSATALRHHVFYYHRSAADEYMCDQCGRSFRSKYRLNLHKKKEHGGTKDFECTTCGKKFFERMHLKRHVDKTHKNIRPYVCDFCGKSFKSKNHIKIHERIHSKEAPYNCHMCGESFKTKLTLRTHLKGVHNVHEEQKVFCDICQRGFASDVALKAHLNSRIHETEKCQYCSEMFTREYMVNHLREFHGMGQVV